MIKRHVDLSEAPGGAETRSHLTARESEPSHYGLNLSIYPGAFSLLFTGKNTMAWVCGREPHTEEDVIEREVSKGKCRILEGVLWG